MEGLSKVAKLTASLADSLNAVFIMSKEGQGGRSQTVANSPEVLSACLSDVACLRALILAARSPVAVRVGKDCTSSRRESCISAGDRQHGGEKRTDAGNLL